MEVFAVLCCLFLAGTQAAVIRRHSGVVEEVTPVPDPAATSGTRSDAQPRRHLEDETRDGLNGCLGCRRHPGSPDGKQEGERIQLYIEKIKQEILSQLGMTAPPNVTTSPVPENIPEPLKYDDEEEATSFDDTINSDSDDYEHDPAIIHGSERTEPRSRQIIVFGKEVELRHKKQDMKHSFQFEFPATLPVNDIVSVDLWLYSDNSNTEQSNCTNATHTLSVHSLTKDGSQQRSILSQSNLLASQQVPKHPGWFRITLEGTVETLTGSDRTDRGLGVDHGDCVSLKTGPSHRPFLGLRTRRMRRRRRRSNAQRCQDGSTNCCRMHSLYINFREIGWNFIISPHGFEANYCRGTCSVPSVENLVSTRRVHSSLLQKVSRIQNNTDYLPCCAATSFSALSLLYRGEDNVAIQENVPNVRVNSCGCS